MDSLIATAQELLQTAIAPSTQNAYRRTWERFNDFAATVQLSVSLPLQASTVALFIADLVQKGFKPATVASHVSALSYFHKMNSLPDPTAAFFIQKMISSYQKRHPSLDARLPIDKHILKNLVTALGHTCPSVRERMMFQAMYMLAFHAFLRIGEITVHSATQQNPNLLGRHQLALKQSAMSVTFHQFKHSNGQRFTLDIQEGPSGECPIQAMRNYLHFRGNTPGPLFLKAPQVPVTRSAFNTQLRLTLAFGRYPVAEFTSHSFRIGAATTAAAQGMSDAQIRQLGRWKSYAFKKYIRNSNRSSSL